jgi:hypothetical protein
MLDLAQLQTRMAQALLGGEFVALEGEMARGPVTAAGALGLHRTTALHGLVNALRLTYPTVDALVGEAFFDQAALAFVEAHPPASSWLTGYGAQFPAFLSSYALAAELPYLPDVARLDAAIEVVASQSLGLDGLAFDLGTALLTLDASLQVIALDYPGAAIRDAIEACDDGALTAIDMTPRPHALALWRMPDGAGLRSLSPFPTTVLEALLHGGDLEHALSAGGDVAALQSEVFTTPFARLTLLERPAP